jgi:hypothetical protein
MKKIEIKIVGTCIPKDEREIQHRKWSAVTEYEDDAATKTLNPQWSEIKGKLESESIE